MAAQYLVADSYTGSPPFGSYVYKLLNYPSGISSPLYVGADIYFCPELIFELTNPGSPSISATQLLFGVFNLYGTFGGQTPPVAPIDYFALVNPNAGPYLYTNSPSDPLVFDWYYGDVGGATITPGLHTLQFHIDVGAQVFEYRVDGVVYPLAYSPGTMDDQFAEFDVLVAGWGSGSGPYPPDVTNLTRFTAGTTGWGSTDVFADDFSSGNLSAWDGFVGGCSVSGAPVCPAGPLPPPPPVITSYPYYIETCRSYVTVTGTGFSNVDTLYLTNVFGTVLHPTWFIVDDNTIEFYSTSHFIPQGHVTVSGPFGSSTGATYFWGCGHAASGWFFDTSVGFRAEG